MPALHIARQIGGDLRHTSYGYARLDNIDNQPLAPLFLQLHKSILREVKWKMKRVFRERARYMSSTETDEPF